MLVGSAVRYLSGRNAVQTIYWRKVKDNASGGFKMVKHIKNFNLGSKKKE